MCSLHRGIAASLLFILPAALFAAASPALDVRPTTTPPVIDGRLDDAAWLDAAHSDALRQFIPLEDVPPTERTEFWLTFDSDFIYVAMRAHDSAGLDGLRAYSMQRDQDNGSDDMVRIVFDTFHRQSDGYFFALTAAGGKHDGLIQNKDQSNFQWDGLWHGKVTRDEGGWSAEFAIPTKSLAFDPANDTWGFNLARALRRKQEWMRWSAPIRAKSTTSLPHAGEIRGLTGLRQGRGLDFKPYASVTRHSDPAPDEDEFEFNPGFDVVWQVTPSLAATFTVNTDFADAEVDERQVNLGRFSLFFPEKRSFFLQDASLFTFAGIQQDPLPFFSRRIGLAADGTKVDVLGGVKLTGRTGPLSVGLLGVHTDDHRDIDAKTLVVGRASIQVFEESSTGVIFTHGDPRTNGDAMLGGVDFNYANTRLADNRTLTIRTSLQGTDSDRVGGKGSAAHFSLRFPNEPFESSWFYSRISEDYDPALGFVSRTGVQNLELWNRYRWYFKDRTVQRLDVYVEGNLVDDLHGNRLDRMYWIGGEIANHRGDWLGANWQPTSEVLDTPFEIRPGIIIPAGDHSWDRGRISLGTTRSRPVNAWIDYRHGGFFTGDRTDYAAELGWRPSNRIELAGEWELREIRLPQGDFNVRVLSGKAVYTFSPDLQLSLLAQYDNVSDELGFNFRTKWTVQPGNEIFFIVNQGYDLMDDHFRPTENETSLKGSWTYRF
ncbi:MAG TPA: DUF5916 domain-containing protein [Opitutaceae bacterium]